MSPSSILSCSSSPGRTFASHCTAIALRLPEKYLPRPDTPHTLREPQPPQPDWLFGWISTVPLSEETTLADVSIIPYLQYFSFPLAGAAPRPTEGRASG